MPTEPGAQLQLHLEPNEPIAVYELTASLTALSRQYQSFVERELPERSGQARLLVSSVAPGSIDISFLPDIQNAIAVAAPAITQLQVITGFAGHIKDLLSKFKGEPEKSEKTSPSEITVRDCDDAINIVKPIAEHGGSQTFNCFNGPVLLQTFNISAPDARSITEEAARRKSELQFPEAERHQRVPLRWFRLDTNVAKQQGSSPDRAIIEEIDEKPKPVFFTDEMTPLKQIMVVGDPFKKTYFVDVEVSRVAGKVASYRVVGFHGVEDDEEEEI